MDTKQRIDLAYSKLGLKEPFIAAVMTRLPREIGDRVPTAATDGKRVWFNPDFVAQCDDAQLFGLVLHESMHVILEHMWRRGDRDPQLWNYANDALINAYIRKRGYKLPDGGVDVPWVRDNMDSEEVYRRLKEDEPEGGYGGGGFDGQGDLEDAPDGATRADIQATIKAAAEMAKAAGQLPGGEDGMFGKMLRSLGKPHVDWRTELRAMMTASARNDYSYRRPNRRFIGSGLYLPSLHDEGLGEIVVAIDTSGSMSDKELQQIANELTHIAEDLRPECIHVVYCDTRVAGNEIFQMGDDIELKLLGGGGTRFKPVFDFVAEQPVQPAGLIYFTDMYGDLDECEAPEYPVIWANTGHKKDHNIPFGVMTHVEN